MIVIYVRLSSICCTCLSFLYKMFICAVENHSCTLKKEFFIIIDIHGNTSSLIINFFFSFNSHHLHYQIAAAVVVVLYCYKVSFYKFIFQPLYFYMIFFSIPPNPLPLVDNWNIFTKNIEEYVLLFSFCAINSWRRCIFVLNICLCVVFDMKL